MLSLLVQTVACWGQEGHEIVGDIASQLVQPSTSQFISSVLTSGTLASVSTWADQVKRSGKYAWTKPLHYVDVHDEQSCSYNDDVDCKDGNCVVGAITQFTQNLCDANKPAADRRDALEFLVHFIGDIAQPLHTCGRDRGGNEASVNYGGKQTNLHAIWDTDMVVDRIRQVASNQDAYTNFLVKQIKSGSYRSSSSSWSSKQVGFSKNNNGNSLMAIDWAQDSSTIDCQGVWGPYDKNPGQDFSNAYFTANAATIDIQLAKGGYRLAAWLDQIAQGCK